MRSFLLFPRRNRRFFHRFACLGLLMLTLTPLTRADAPERKVLLRDITDIEGVRDNQLVGYGLVVGLRGTGDRQQTFFTVQTLANAMKRMGVQIAPGQVVVKNVAAVFITASLPAFSRPGMKVDITVSSAGDAKSLEGGVLLMTSLKGPDGQVYAEAQGALALGVTPKEPPDKSTPSIILPLAVYPMERLWNVKRR